MQAEMVSGMLQFNNRNHLTFIKINGTAGTCTILTWIKYNFINNRKFLLSFLSRYQSKQWNNLLKSTTYHIINKGFENLCYEKFPVTDM